MLCWIKSTNRNCHKFRCVRVLLVVLSFTAHLYFSPCNVVLSQSDAVSENNLAAKESQQSSVDVGVEKQGQQSEDRGLLALQYWAPEECVFYFSWTGWDDLQPTRSTTEQWLSQPELLTAAHKIVREGLSFAEKQLDKNEFEKLQQWLPLFTALAKNPSAVSVYQLPSDSPDGVGQLPSIALVSDLGDQLQVVKHILNEAKVDRQDEASEVAIGGLRFSKVTIPYLPSCYYGVMKNRLVLATDQLALQQLVQDSKSAIPAWLSDYLASYCSDHQTGLIWMNLKKVSEFLRQNQPEDLQKILDVLEVEQATGLVLVSSLSARGTILRGELKVRQPVSGIYQLLAPKGNLNLQHLSAVDSRSDQVHQMVFPLRELLPFVRRCAEKVGSEDPTAEPIRQFRQDVDMDIEKLLESLSGRVTVYGKLSMPFPLKGWVVSVGVEKSGQFVSEFGKLMLYFQNHPAVHVTEDQRDGRTVYKIVSAEDFYVVFDGDELLLSANRRSLSKHWKRKEEHAGNVELQRESISETGGFAELWEIEYLGERPYLYLATVDLRPYLELSHSLLALVFQEPIGDSQLTLSDVPELKVITGFWEPSLIAIYPTESGFDFYVKQTTPIVWPSSLATLFLLELTKRPAEFSQGSSFGPQK